MKVDGLNPSPNATPTWGHRQTLPRGVASPQHQEAFRGGSTREDAKETAHAMANIRVHRRSHMRATENCMYGGASRALECANICKVCTASSLHLPRLHGEQDELAPSGGSKFGICRLLVLACLQHHRSIVISCMWVGFASATDRAAQSDVHSQLNAAMTRKTLSQNFDLPRVLGCHVNIHVPEEDILSDTRACLAENTRCHALCGCGSPLHPPASWTRRPVVSQQVQRCMTSLTRCLHDLQWQVRSLKQQRSEETRLNGEFRCGGAMRQRDACVPPRMRPQMSPA